MNRFAQDPRHPQHAGALPPGGVDVRLNGKVAIVTGAGGGIGKALATRLATDGASVVVADVQKFDVAAAEIAKATGARTLGVQTDVSSEADVARMADQVVKAFGRIDILVNNAAIFSSLKLKPFEQIGVEEWRKVMEVNILGVALCCRACVPHMRKAGGGRIINLASARRSRACRCSCTTSRARAR
jgi:NAD(P)-dependent dehydrogenase (short-subunit alcohol dehydrogenase family)